MASLAQLAELSPNDELALIGGAIEATGAMGLSDIAAWLDEPKNLSRTLLVATDVGLLKCVATLQRNPPRWDIESTLQPWATVRGAAVVFAGLEAPWGVTVSLTEPAFSASQPGDAALLREALLAFGLECMKRSQVASS